MWHPIIWRAIGIELCMVVTCVYFGHGKREIYFIFLSLSVAFGMCQSPFLWENDGNKKHRHLHEQCIVKILYYYFCINAWQNKKNLKCSVSRSLSQRAQDFILNVATLEATLMEHFLFFIHYDFRFFLWISFLSSNKFTRNFIRGYV